MFDFLFYFLLMVIVFGGLIFIHEFGHFIMARICKVEVKEFAIGMGPKLFSKISKKYGTKYTLRALPIGGFVSMDEDKEVDDNPNSFSNQSILKRMAIIITGPLMNLLLGFILMFCIVFSQQSIYSTTIERFGKNAASSEYLQIDDEILKIENTRVYTYDEIWYEITNKGYEPIDITLKRNGETIIVENVPFLTSEEGGASFGSCDFITYKDSPTFLNYLKHSIHRSFSTVKMIIDSLVGLLNGRFGMEAISGPIGVVEAVGDAAKRGFSTFIYIVTVLSVNLGVFNMIPFPALDGGRFLFLMIEGIIGRPINKNVEGFINFAGLVLLFGFMIFVSLKDILKLIFG